MAQFKLICSECGRSLDVIMDLPGEIRVNPCRNCEDIGEGHKTVFQDLIHDIEEMVKDVKKEIEVSGAAIVAEVKKYEERL